MIHPWTQRDTKCLQTQKEYISSPSEWITEAIESGYTINMSVC